MLICRLSRIVKLRAIGDILNQVLMHLAVRPAEIEASAAFGGDVVILQLHQV